MATSNIKTGLKLKKLPTSIFTWNSVNKYFGCSKADAETAMEDLTPIDFIAVGNRASSVVFNANLSGGSTSYVTVSGWNCKTGASVDSDFGTSFSVYAIGY